MTQHNKEKHELVVTVYSSLCIHMSIHNYVQHTTTVFFSYNNNGRDDEAGVFVGG